MYDASLTDDYINMLKDDDQSRLETFYRVTNIVNIDFNEVYVQVKDIHNSSVYFVLATFIYMWGHCDDQSLIDEAKALYYLRKSANMGNPSALDEIKITSGDRGIKFPEIVNSIFKFMDKHIDLEEKCEQFKKENEELKKMVKHLETENTELRYRPDGDGYSEAKEHFTGLVSNNE